MNMNSLAAATVSIKIGDDPIGSGFRFIHEDIIITNSHILPASVDGVPIKAVTESGNEIRLDLRDVSVIPEQGGKDYAILQATEELEETTELLEPAANEPSRGDSVWFAGHPFHISEVIVNTATISGEHPHGFYLDGSVNHGNSGGPIVKEGTNEVLGIATESQVFKDSSLGDNINSLKNVQQRLLRIQEVHNTTIHDVNVEDLAVESVQDIQQTIEILSTNITSGIGIGYSIDPVVNNLDELGLRES